MVASMVVGSGGAVVAVLQWWAAAVLGVGRNAWIVIPDVMVLDRLGLMLCLELG
jgi:hypothetical protein